MTDSSPFTSSKKRGQQDSPVDQSTSADDDTTTSPVRVVEDKRKSNKRNSNLTALAPNTPVKRAKTNADPIVEAPTMKGDISAKIHESKVNDLPEATTLSGPVSSPTKQLNQTPASSDQPPVKPSSPATIPPEPAAQSIPDASLPREAEKSKAAVGEGSDSTKSNQSPIETKPNADPPLELRVFRRGQPPGYQGDQDEQKVLVTLTGRDGKPMYAHIPQKDFTIFATQLFEVVPSKADSYYRGLPVVNLKNEATRRWFCYVQAHGCNPEAFRVTLRDHNDNAVGVVDDITWMHDGRWKIDLSQHKNIINQYDRSKYAYWRLVVSCVVSRPEVKRNQVLRFYRTRVSKGSKRQFHGDKECSGPEDHLPRSEFEEPSPQDVVPQVPRPAPSVPQVIPPQMVMQMPDARGMVPYPQMPAMYQPMHAMNPMMMPYFMPAAFGMPSVAPVGLTPEQVAQMQQAVASQHAQQAAGQPPHTGQQHSHVLNRMMAPTSQFPPMWGLPPGVFAASTQPTAAFSPSGQHTPQPSQLPQAPSPRPGIAMSPFAKSPHEQSTHPRAPPVPARPVAAQPLFRPSALAAPTPARSPPAPATQSNLSP